MKEKAGTALAQPTTRVVGKRELSDSNDDLTFWLSQSPVARLLALQNLRRQHTILFGMELITDFQDLVKLLNTHQVEYMIAGGFAVAMYGYPRYTGDIDIWVNPTQQNAVYMLQVIQQLGFADHHVTLEDLTTPDIVVQLGYPPNRIDMSTGLTGVDFAACWERKVSQPFGNTTAYFISLNDLRETKKATARQQDLLDLQNLPE